MTRRLVALFIVALACGCQRDQDRATEAIVEKIIASKGREADVEIDRERGAIRVTLGGAIKPDGWPSAVPIYPNAERAKIEGGDTTGQRLTVVTGDKVAELRDFYREALGKAGWQLVDGKNPDAPWSARRGDENLQMRFAERGRGKGSRAEIEYQKSS